MVKITMISEDIDEVTGKRQKVKLNLSFWSIMKIYLIAWFITTGIIVGITILARSIIESFI